MAPYMLCRCLHYNATVLLFGQVRRTGLSSHTEQRLRVACSLLAILLETTSSVVVLILTWRILRASDPLDKVGRWKLPPSACRSH